MNSDFHINVDSVQNKSSSQIRHTGDFHIKVEFTQTDANKLRFLVTDKITKTLWVIENRGLDQATKKRLRENLDSYERIVKVLDLGDEEAY